MPQHALAGEMHFAHHYYSMKFDNVAACICSHVFSRSIYQFCYRQQEATMNRLCWRRLPKLRLMLLERVNPNARRVRIEARLLNFTGSKGQKKTASG